MTYLVHQSREEHPRSACQAQSAQCKSSHTQAMQPESGNQQVMQPMRGVLPCIGQASTQSHIVNNVGMSKTNSQN